MDKLPVSLIAILEKQTGLSIVSPVHHDIADQLATHIDWLIVHDFNKLVALLYRLDINEYRLREILHEQQGVNAGRIIASLIIERELQKIKSRSETKK
jgi:hypothetical protein